MPQKQSTYGDIITTQTVTDVQEPQAVTTTAQQHKEQKLPRKRLTSQGPYPSQKDEDQTTPIRATVTAEIPTETEKTNKEKSKTDIKEIKTKK